MPQPPPPGFATRAMTPVRNPIYLYNVDSSFKATPTPRHVLETPPRGGGGVDPRLTSAGTRPPVAGLTPIVPYAAQTPYNVWGLFPA